MDKANYSDEDKLYGFNEIVKIRNKKSNKINKKLLFVNKGNINQKIIKIVFTQHNQFFLTSDGQVYSKGKGKILGIKKDEKNDLNKVLSRVVFYKFFRDPFSEGDFMENEYIPSESPIFDISAGENHVLALDSEGKVWGWGKNDFKQVNPDLKEDFVEIPIILGIKKMKINKIFAKNNSSYAICSGNKIISWGEVNNKEQKNKFKNEETKFNYHEDISVYLNNILSQDNTDFLDAFLDSERIINRKYITEISEEKNKGIESKYLANKQNSLQKGLNLRNDKEKLLQINNIDNIKDNDKNINVLKTIISETESKINKLNKEKIKIKKNIQRYDKEITKQKSNLKDNLDLLNEYESIIEIKESQKEIVQNKIKQIELELEKLLENKNLLNELLQFSTLNYLEKENNIEGVSFLETKTKSEITSYLMEKNEKIEELTFLNINEKDPFRPIEDILRESNDGLNQIKEEYLKYKIKHSEISINNMEILFQLFDSKIELVTQQNNIIEIIHNILKNLKESDIISFLTDPNIKESLSEQINQNIEFMLKLRDSQKTTYENTKNDKTKDLRKMMGTINFGNNKIKENTNTNAETPDENETLFTANSIDYINKEIIISILKEISYKLKIASKLRKTNEENIEDEENVESTNKKKISKNLFINYLNKQENSKNEINELKTEIDIDNDNFTLYKEISKYDYKNDIIVPEHKFNWGTEQLFGKKEEVTKK